MLLQLIFNIFFILQSSINKSEAQNFEAFAQEDESSYIQSFDTLIKDSYSAPMPNELASACKSKGQLSSSETASITTSMTSTQLQIFCGASSICTIPAGYTVTMNSNLNLAALVVKGTLLWTDDTQVSSHQWICAGYIAVDSGRFEMNLLEKHGYIYIKNNGLKDDSIKTRAFGSYNTGKIYVTGRSFARTWSLLGGFYRKYYSHLIEVSTFLI
jgi:hypothetical protein